MNQLQKLMPRLLEEHKDNTALLRAAMANPILALDHIGIALTPSLKTEVERRVRFDTKTRKKIAAIEKDVEKNVGKQLPLSDIQQIETFLKNELSKTKTKPTKKVTDELLRALNQSPTSQDAIKEAFGNSKTYSYLQSKDRKRTKDPLTEYKKVHQIIPILLKYRALEAQFPRLASKEAFDNILKEKSPERGVRFSKVRFRLQDREQRKATTVKV